LCGGGCGVGHGVVSRCCVGARWADELLCAQFPIVANPSDSGGAVL
jgi:hypothetical protein